MSALAFPPATRARPVRETRLLVIRVASRTVREASIAELPELLSPGDALVVNDAATLPASLFGRTRKNEPLELRLLALPGASRQCDVVVFGRGDWRTPTEHRAAPPPLSPGDVLLFDALEARVVSARDARRAVVVFERDRDEVVAALYRAGKPVQYAHMSGELHLWDVQNVYAAEPWAAEMPSAGRPLDFATMDALRKHGIAVARLTHGAGLSSIGDAATDASLPWVERYRIPEQTADIVSKSRRVIAVGTSVVRALESSARDNGRVRAGEATTSLRIDETHALRAVHGLITGMHDGATSHADLVSAFVPRALLHEASKFAQSKGFLGHELGDSTLILGD
jgi:S-adenosylmethionine:tRNA ribosyltransferase-isomerase